MDLRHISTYSGMWLTKFVIYESKDIEVDEWHQIILKIEEKSIGPKVDLANSVMQDTPSLGDGKMPKQIIL